MTDDFFSFFISEGAHGLGPGSRPEIERWRAPYLNAFLAATSQISLLRASANQLRSIQMSSHVVTLNTLCKVLSQEGFTHAFIMTDETKGNINAVMKSSLVLPKKILPKPYASLPFTKIEILTKEQKNTRDHCENLTFARWIVHEQFRVKDFSLKDICFAKFHEDKLVGIDDYRLKVFRQFVRPPPNPTYGYNWNAVQSRGFCGLYVHDPYHSEVYSKYWQWYDVPTVDLWDWKGVEKFEIFRNVGQDWKYVMPDK